MRATEAGTASSGTAIEAFFGALANHRHALLLTRIHGTLEVDIEGWGRRWIVVERGNVVISQTPIKADCVLVGDDQTFARIFSGTQNLVAAAIRGSVRVSGDKMLGLSIQRIASYDNEGN